jgi:hypothetical protein
MSNGVQLALLYDGEIGPTWPNRVGTPDESESARLSELTLAPGRCIRRVARVGSIMTYDKDSRRDLSGPCADDGDHYAEGQHAREMERHAAL